MSDANLTVAEDQPVVLHVSDDSLALGVGTEVYNVPVWLKTGVLRPDAELVKSWSYDKWMIEDEVLESLPAYTTSATTLVASETIDTVTADRDSYDYCFLIRTLATPTYNTNTKAKGRAERWYGSAIVELIDVPEGYLITQDGTVYPHANGFSGVCQKNYLLYWGSATSVALYGSGSYGVYLSPAAPTISGSTLTVKSPAFAVRGHTTYLTSTYMNALTDIRYQYVIEFYRASKDNLNLNGWGLATQMLYVCNCANSASGKLL